MNSPVHCTHVTVDTFSGITPPDVKSMWVNWWLGAREKILERVADQRPEVSSNPTQLKSAFIIMVCSPFFSCCWYCITSICCTHPKTIWWHFSLTESNTFKCVSVWWILGSGSQVLHRRNLSKGCLLLKKCPPSLAASLLVLFFLSNVDKPARLRFVKVN